MKKQIIAAGIIGLLIGGAAGAYGGMTFSKSKAPAFRTTSGQNARGFAGATGATGARGAGNGTSGQVVSKDATSFTVKLQSGGSAVVFFGTSTPVMTSQAGSIADVSVGTEVMVTGSQNSDGSVSAQSIRILPTRQ